MHHSGKSRSATPPSCGWKKDDAARFKNMADTVFRPVYRWLVVDVEAALGRPLKGLRILDIGGGPGHMAIEFLRAGVERIIEVDLSKTMIDLAVESISRLDAEQASRFSGLIGEAAALPVETGSVDLVFSRGSIQFWPDLAGAFDEIYRVLSVGGSAYLGRGYGLRTPPELVAEIARRREERETQAGGPSRIPQMDRDAMLRLARERGGGAVFLGPSPGSWLHWRPAK